MEGTEDDKLKVYYYGYSRGKRRVLTRGIDGYPISLKENDTLPTALQEANLPGDFAIQHSHFSPCMVEMATFQHVEDWTVIAFWDVSRIGAKGGPSPGIFMINDTFPLTQKGWEEAYSICYDSFHTVFEALSLCRVYKLEWIANKWVV